MILTFRPLNLVTGHPCHGHPSCYNHSRLKSGTAVTDGRTDDSHQRFMPHPIGRRRNKPNHPSAGIFFWSIITALHYRQPMFYYKLSVYANRSYEQLRDSLKHINRLMQTTAAVNRLQNRFHCVFVFNTLQWILLISRQCFFVCFCVFTVCMHDCVLRFSATSYVE